MNANKLVLLTAAVSCALAVGCGSKAPTDDAIKTDIQSKLYADATTKAASISVDVKQGTVTLSGDVPTSDVELEAMKVANGTTGVRSVTDQMKVQAAAAVPPPASENQQAPPPPANPSAPPAPEPAPPPSQTAAPISPPAQEPAPAPAAAPVAPSEPPPPPKPIRTTIPAGQSFSVRMIDSIDSKTNSTGQTFRASLNAPMTRNGHTVIPSGAPVTVTLTNAKGAGRIKGSSELSVAVTSIEYHGRAFPVDSNVNTEQGKGRGKQTAVRTGIGAAAGALIGGLAGGGKGAAIGTAVGGGGTFGFQALTHGQQVKIPSETVLTFTLDAPLTVERMPQ
ncbi:MAG: BON domain-containing protein [Acidobacteriaceae bacterium]|nr:BON domain-containing protein [Acidobacteriaceae bacterium]